MMSGMESVWDRRESVYGRYKAGLKKWKFPSVTFLIYLRHRRNFVLPLI